MVHKFLAPDARSARAKFPDAAILRPVGNEWLAFDTCADAFWHRTAQVDPSIRRAS